MKISRPRAEKLWRSKAGVSLVELSIMIGVMAILSLAIASISNFGFQSLKHVRIGNDIQTVENLVSLNLMRPPTAAETAAGKRVCPSSIPGMTKYSGSIVDNLDVVDSSGKSILKALNDKEYTIKAQVDAPINGTAAIDFQYPDDKNGGTLGLFKFWLTQMFIYGEKQGDQNLGGKIVRARVALGVITRPDGTFYDCIVNPTDYKQICLMLGGKHDPTKNPVCLLTRLAVASDWSKIPDNTLFKTGTIYGENLLMLGDQANVKEAQRQWSVGNGVVVGGSNSNLNKANPKGFGIVLGEHSSGTAAGLAVNLNNLGMYSLMGYPTPTAGWTAAGFTKGAVNLRTYGERPLVIDTCPDSGDCLPTMEIKTKKDKQMVVAHGPVVSSQVAQSNPILNADTVIGVDNVGFAAYYTDNKRIAIGRSGDQALGTFISDFNAGLNPATLGGFYFTKNYPGNANGALVMKAYHGSDLVFITRQTIPGTIPLIIRGATENVGIGNSNPSARLEVNAPSVASPGLYVTGTSSFTGAMSITGNVTINGNARATGTVFADSDQRLKTDIKPVTNALEKILQINGVYYKWKRLPANQSRQLGLIAQNVESVFPEAVTTDEKGIKSVAYQNLISPVIEAIKEQQKQIDELKHDREQLKNTLDRVLQRLCDKDPKDSLCE